MKKLLSIVLLITALLLGSCKEEPVVERVEKGATKSVKGLSYTFSKNAGENTVKSGNHPDSTQVLSPIERKVLSIDTLEIGGETFIASLIEENDLIETKATNPQVVDGASVYTFYAYKDSKIKPQTVAPKGTFDVPVDAATKYGIIFLSSAMGMDNPNKVTQITNQVINTTKKSFTYKAKFNENVCYETFHSGNMPNTNPIDVTFKPVFSQLGISVPSKVGNRIIKVEEVKLESGGQQEATVNVVYNPDATNNIDVTYNDNLANYAVDLTHKLNPADNITYLYPNGEDREPGYYNIIPNRNYAKVKITMLLSGTPETTKSYTIDFKKELEKGKRYTISLTNKVPISIELEDLLNIEPEKKGTLTVTKVKMSDGSEIAPTTGFTWTINSPNGVVTSKDGGVVVLGTDKNIVTGSSTTNVISLTAKPDYYGSTTVTVTYGGLSTTAKVNVYRNIPETEYYMWDAYKPYDYASNPTGIEPPWGPTSSGYNTGTDPAEQSCANAPTKEQMNKYLGADVYWAEDGPPFMDVNGNIHRKGLLLKKYANIPEGTVLADGVKPKTNFSEESSTDQAQHFFLPACGYYDSGRFRLAGTFGIYWLSTPITANANRAYSLVFISDDASVHYHYRYYGRVPLVGFDPTYEEPKSIVLTAKPTTISKGESSTLTAEVTYVNGSKKTNPAGINFSSSNINVIAHPGSTAIAKGKAGGYANITASITVNGRTVQSAAVKITVEETVGSITISPDPLNIETGQEGALTATVKNSDGNPLTPTSDFKWEITNTGVVTGSSITNKIILTGALVSSSTTVRVTYKGVSATATVNVILPSTFTADNYYMWDAYMPYDYKNNPTGTDPSWGPTSSGYNTGSDPAEQSCKDAPTYDQIKMYLGAGVYWVTDGPAYKLPGGQTYHTGLMVKKSGKIPGFIQGTAVKVESTAPETGVSYESLKDDYFFLPACGYYGSGSFLSAGTNGDYWLSTPNTAGTSNAYSLNFYSGYAYVSYNLRSYARVPMPRF